MPPRKNPVWLRLTAGAVFLIACLAVVYAACEGEISGMEALAAASLPLAAFVFLRGFVGRHDR